MVPARVPQFETVGYGRSLEQTYTIASGDTVGAFVDFGRKYTFFLVRVLDASNIAAATTITAQAADVESEALQDVFVTNDPASVWSKGSLPTSGAFRFLFSEAWGARLLRFTLSVAASGGSVEFQIVGVDPIVGD